VQPGNEAAHRVAAKGRKRVERARIMGWWNKSGAKMHGDYFSEHVRKT